MLSPCSRQSSGTADNLWNAIGRESVWNGRIDSQRNMIGRGFNNLKNSRRQVTCYDKTADSFLGFVDVASIRLWLPHLST